MKTEGIAVILVLAGWQAGAKQEKKKSEISLFDPFSTQAPPRQLQNKKLKVRKLRTTIKPKAITEGSTKNSISPDLVDRPKVDYRAESHSRQETVDEDGNIVGSYSYKDPNGDLVVVRYVAGKDGYRVLADIPSDASETTTGISNDDWIQDIRRRTTRRTTTTTRSTTTTKTTTLPTSTVTLPWVSKQQTPFQQQQQLGQRLFQNTQQSSAQHEMQLGQRLFQNPQQSDRQEQLVPKHDFTIRQQFTEQQFEPTHQFTPKQQFTAHQRFTEEQQFTPQQQFTQQQQFTNQKQFTTQQQFTQQRQFPKHNSQQQENQPQQMFVSQQANPQQRFITQQQFTPQQFRSQSSPSLEESVLHQQQSHEQFLDNNRHRLFVQSPQQQPAQQRQQQFQNTPQFSPQLFNQQNQQLQNEF